MRKAAILHFLIMYIALCLADIERPGSFSNLKSRKPSRQKDRNRQTVSKLKSNNTLRTATSNQICEYTIISASKHPINDSVERLSSVLCILLPWLYFLSNSINMPSFPKYVNSVINNGDASVSSLSQKVYGDFSGLDSFFTFLSVNFIGCLSDTFGRKPFIFLSLAGLGMSYVISSLAQGPSLFYLAGCIDGISSCMLSQAQAYVTDRSHVQHRNQLAQAKSKGFLDTKINNNNKRLRSSSSQISEAIGRFQGLAIGSAYVVGIPLGELLSRAGNRRTPLYMSIFLCTIGCVLTAFFLPESLPRIAVPSTTTRVSIAMTNTAVSVIPIAPTLFQLKLREIKWRQANPFGALNMLFSRGNQLALGTLVYFFVNIAQTGTNVVWMNYLEYRFGWSQVQAGSAYMALGLMVIVIPKLLISTFGKSEALRVALLAHALALFTIGSASNSQIVAYVGIPLLSIGISASTLSLGYLSEQVSENESGALQGAADTIRSIANMLANPLMSRIMSYYIKQGKRESGRSLFISAFSSCIALIFYSLIQLNAT